MRKNDFLLLGLLLLLAGAGYLFSYFGATSAHKILIIQHNDKIVQRLDLKNEKVEKKLAIPTEHGEVIVRYDKDGARVSSSPCPDKICIHQGKITKAGDAIACLPEKVLVALTTPGKEQEHDAILR